MPSGVQLRRPIVPPGRQTRTSSSATVLVVRREHRADRGHDDVEGFVVEREILCVGFDPLELEPLGSLRGPARVEQLRGEVARGHVGAALRRRKRRVARARRHVQDAHAVADSARFDQRGPERQQERLDHGGVVARRPHLPVAALEL